MFHPILGVQADEKQKANFREFAGDGTPYLKVPGLKKVKRVRVGEVELENFKQSVPTDLTLRNFEEQEVEVFRLETLSDGTPVLLRNIQSNDGLWQAGATVYVAGDYEDEKPGRGAKTPATPPATGGGEGDPSGQQGQGA